MLFGINLFFAGVYSLISLHLHHLWVYRNTGELFNFLFILEFCLCLELQKRFLEFGVCLGSLFLIILYSLRISVLIHILVGC